MMHTLLLTTASSKNPLSDELLLRPLWYASVYKTCLYSRVNETCKKVASYSNGNKEQGGIPSVEYRVMCSSLSLHSAHAPLSFPPFTHSFFLGLSVGVAFVQDL